MLVGYNDVRVRQLDPPGLAGMVADSAAYRCPIWLTLPSRPGGQPGSNAMVASGLVDQLNLHAAHQVALHRRVHAATDWRDAVTVAPVGSLLQDDGVHPNAAGRVALASAIHQAIARSC